MAGKLAESGSQGNVVCSLCNHEDELAAHFILYCLYALEQSIILAWGAVQMPAQGLDIRDWWRDDLSDLLKERSFMAAAMMYIAWNIWKERSRRIF